MSFRLRVTLLAAAAVAAAVAASAAVVYVVVRHQLLGEVDSSLVSRAHGFIEHPPPGFEVGYRAARAAGQPRRPPDLPPGDRLHRPGSGARAARSRPCEAAGLSGREAVLHGRHRVDRHPDGDGERPRARLRGAGRGRVRDPGCALPGGGRPHAPPARAVHADHRARRRRFRRRPRPGRRDRGAPPGAAPHLRGGGGDRDPRPHPPHRRLERTTSSAGSRPRSTRCWSLSTPR